MRKPGSLLAVMDGRYITEARTALRRSDRSGGAGAGTQKRHDAGDHRQRRAGRESFAGFVVSSRISRSALLEPHGGILASSSARIPEVQPAESVEAAVRDADVVVVATSATTPIVFNDWIAAGAFVCSVGACRPTQREMDGRLVARGRLIVDSRAAALKESGDIVMAMAEGHFGPDHIAGELGEVLAGRIPGRTSDDQLVILKPLGQAVEMPRRNWFYQRACCAALRRRRGVTLA